MTISNSLIPSVIGIPLGIACISPTIKSLYANHKLHLKKCREELTSKQKYMLAGALAIMIAGQILAACLEKLVLNKVSMAGTFLSINAIAWFSIFTNSMELSNNREISQMKERIRQECHVLAAKIEILKENVEKLDQFIKNQPELLNLIYEKLENQEWFTRNLDPVTYSAGNEIINKRTNFSIELSRREYYLDKRICFIQQNQDVYELFCKCVEKQNATTNMLIRL